MKEKAMKIARGLIAMLITALWSSCAVEDPFSGTSNILARFGLKSTAALDGKITVAEAYLKLDRIEVTGNLGGNSNPTATHSVSPDEPPYRLSESDSSHANFSVQSRAYDELDLHLFLKREDYKLVFLGESVEGEQPDVPQPGENAGETDADEDGAPEGNGDVDGEGNEAPGDNGQGEDKEGSTDDDEGHDDDDDKDDDGHKHDDKDDDDDEGDDDDDEGNDDDDEGDDDDDEGDRDSDDDKDDKGDKSDRDDDKKDKDKDRGDDDDDGDDDRKSSNAENRAVDLDHFFQNAKPGLVVFGLYQNNGKVINLIFVATDVEKISMRGRQNDNTSILLAAQNTAQITFDPEKWFESLTPAEIESGSMQTYQRQTVLFIHPDYNAELYQSIVSKLEASADLHVSLPEAAESL